MALVLFAITLYGTALAHASTIVNIEQQIDAVFEIPLLDDISLSETSMTLKNGTSWTLIASASDSVLPLEVTWNSSDPTIASVSNNGLVSALSAGTATITATAADGRAAACVVVVTCDKPLVTDGDLGQVVDPRGGPHFSAGCDIVSGGHFLLLFAAAYLLNKKMNG